VNELTKPGSRNEGGGHATVEIDDLRRPVWLEATESFYKKLNRIAGVCGLTRYQALSKGLDALMREMEIRNSALNQKIKSPSPIGGLPQNDGPSLTKLLGDGR